MDIGDLGLQADTLKYRSLSVASLADSESCAV